MPLSLDHQTQGEIVLSVIIVNWNGGQVVIDCLESLHEVMDESFEVFVVDNASSDHSVEEIRQKYPWVVLICNHSNLGFSVANNQGAAQARGRFLLLLNPDTQVLPGALQAVVDFADAHPDIGCIGPRLLHADGSLQRSCWKNYPGIRMAFSDAFYLWKLPFLPMAREVEYPLTQLEQPLDVDHILGACMLIRKETWEQVGGLDENFFLFLEETDWCYRAKSKGWRIVYYPYAEIIHLGEHSVNQNPERNLPQFYKSYCLFVRKRAESARMKMLFLKAIIAIAAVVRILLWKWRALSRDAKYAHAQSMLGGYVKVLKSLPSY
jgi:GT2 family glycosyltransferase